MIVSIRILQDHKRVIEASLKVELNTKEVAILNREIADLTNSIEILKSNIKEEQKQEQPENQTNIFDQGA